MKAGAGGRSLFHAAREQPDPRRGARLVWAAESRADRGESAAEGGGTNGGRAAPEISDKLHCSACQCPFDSREEQTEHYKLDWHRFNLRQRLAGARPVPEEEFEKIAGDISSLSGSDSEDTSSDSEDDLLRCGEARKSVPELESEAGECQPARHSQRLLFRNAEGQYLSVYRCVLQGKQEAKEEELVTSLQKLSSETIWAVLMTGGGHFAGAIFQGSEALRHKTFHRYTVRAKRGTAQSVRDGQARGHAPKSAGAALRRHNEAALVKDIQELMESWSEYLQEASAIFLRAPSYNRGIFHGGKGVPGMLSKSDPRLRTIPFDTRRATFKEVKRVHETLSSLQLYGKDADVGEINSPSKRLWKKIVKPRAEETDSEKEDQEDSDPTNAPCLLETVEETLSTEGLRGLEVWPRHKRRRRRKKPAGEGEVAPDPQEERGCRNPPQASPSLVTDSAPTEETRQPKSKRPVSAQEQEYYRLRDALYTACKTGDVDSLRSLLTHPLPPSGAVAPHTQTPETAEHTMERSGDVTIGSESGSRMEGGGESLPDVGQPDVAAMLNGKLDTAGVTLLHVASAAGQRSILRLLMDSGCDPSVRDGKGQPAYAVSADKETRNEFRKYMADYPEKYDYTRAQVPGPLTAEIQSKKAEKKRAQKAVKKQKEKEQREERKRKEGEEDEMKRYAALSDREKRALAAEKRFACQLAAGGGTLAHGRRCWLCGVSLLGRIPFEYLDYAFCSTRCLQEHRRTGRQ
ncbi:ankyrin repeat and zinc finger domain-containing protein 1 [Callorhinchus milii]|uniref:ankyrin repeat and zinc finger domain-containing protein 1 n=1 Tax=Callorhinchus milii TaxID=7868 RepID=UPI001C3FD460|nr:ankyrin repeat and zinc finger domain-containing protein 1 [Callorhinchus milii]